MGFFAAVLQLNGSSDEAANWAQVEALAARAAEHGAHWIGTPENTNFLGPHEEKVRRAEPLDGPTCQRFAALAARLHVHLLLGSFNEKSEETDRCYNTSVLFGAAGERLAVYRKIHLFDIEHGDAVRFRESATCKPGEQVVVAKTALGSFGLSICYDLRFGELYRKLASDGAEILTVPSAFTLTTGRDHWEPLLRARAIETQCYVVAPAQWGRHDDRGLKESYGHAMIVDPWGQVIASVPDGVGLAIAELDLDRVRRVRQSMPVEEHRRARRVEL